MPNLYQGHDEDGWIWSGIQSSWAAARDITSGGTPNANNSATGFPVASSRFSGRGGGNTYRVVRSFMWFDTSGITGAVSAATIKLYGYNQNNGSIIAVKSTAFGGDTGDSLVAGDIDAITGWTTGASAAGNVTNYSSQITSGWNASGYNDLTGTSDLRSDMQNNNYVIICFMDYTYDYLNSAPTANQTKAVGFYWNEQTSTSKDPYIEYTVATGYGNAVKGVAAANISKVNGIATASISKVNGI